MERFVLALDQGTTSSRAILFDRSQKICGMVQKEFANRYPHPGWVEQDPMEIYAGQYSVMMELLAKADITPEQLAAIGITNQRETTIVWDKHTGKPIYNAIVWQCRRTAPLCEQLEGEGWSDYIRETTGLLIDAYFSATKIHWILHNVQGAKEKAEKGELLFGTVDTWLLWKLTDGKVHATDVTNASRTMLYNIHTGQWDKKLCDRLDIPMEMLPTVLSSSEIYGTVNIGGVDVPISGVAGDQQAALFGQTCFAKGQAKNTYGTGGFLLMHTGDTPAQSENGLITTIAATRKGQPTQYALEGSVFVGGAVIQWVRDALRLITDAEDSEYYAMKAKDTGGVYLVPAFTGLGAPYWDMHARGTIVGLTRGTGRRHIVRAALESIAYQTQDVIAAMEQDIGGKISALQVYGGASANKFLMQFRADISDVEIRRPLVRETTALGAALLAGLAVGYWKDEQDIINGWTPDNAYTPKMDISQRTAALKGWHKAVKAAKVWAEED